MKECIESVLRCLKFVREVEYVTKYKGIIYAKHYFYTFYVVKIVERASCHKIKPSRMLYVKSQVVMCRVEQRCPSQEILKLQF